ncbi:MAG: hypothetical protein U0V04_11995 [Spirosomataceae bacterium]
MRGSVFDHSKSKKMDKSEDVTALYEQIGRLQMDITFLKKLLDQNPEGWRWLKWWKKKVKWRYLRQCDLVGVCRSTLYYKPTGQNQT